MKFIKDDVEANRKAMFHSPAGGLHLILKGALWTINHRNNNNLTDNDTDNDNNVMRKRKQKHAHGNFPCPHCEQFNHLRITLQICPYNNTYRQKMKTTTSQSSDGGIMNHLLTFFGNLAYELSTEDLLELVMPFTSKQAQNH